MAGPRRSDLLSARQAGVAAGLALGLTQDEVADRLRVSAGTVKTDLSALRVRLDYRGTVTGLIVECLRRGVIPLPKEMQS